MRIGTRTFDGPEEVILVIPRESGDVVFRAKAVMDRKPFDLIYPEPEVPQVFRPKGQGVSYNLEDEGYKQAVRIRNAKFLEWLVLESLKATPDLVWDTVDPANPASWLNYRIELQEAGFNQVEITRIVNLAIGVNSVDEAKLEEAKRRFLASREAPDTNP